MTEIKAYKTCVCERCGAKEVIELKICPETRYLVDYWLLPKDWRTLMDKLLCHSCMKVVQETLKPLRDNGVS